MPSPRKYAIMLAGPTGPKGSPSEILMQSVFQELKKLEANQPVSILNFDDPIFEHRGNVEDERKWRDTAIKSDAIIFLLGTELRTQSSTILEFLDNYLLPKRYIVLSEMSLKGRQMDMNHPGSFMHELLNVRRAGRKDLDINNPSEAIALALRFANDSIMNLKSRDEEAQLLVEKLKSEKVEAAHVLNFEIDPVSAEMPIYMQAALLLLTKAHYCRRTGDYSSALENIIKSIDLSLPFHEKMNVQRLLDYLQTQKDHDSTQTTFLNHIAQYLSPWQKSLLLLSVSEAGLIDRFTKHGFNDGFKKEIEKYEFVFKAFKDLSDFPILYPKEYTPACKRFHTYSVRRFVEVFIAAASYGGCPWLIPLHLGDTWEPEFEINMKDLINWPELKTNKTQEIQMYAALGVYHAAKKSERAYDLITKTKNLLAWEGQHNYTLFQYWIIRDQTQRAFFKSEVDKHIEKITEFFRVRYLANPDGQWHDIFKPVKKPPLN